MDIATLEQKARLRRADIITMISQANTGHTGGAMSVTDILCALYYDVMNVSPERTGWPERDRFVLSKGHSVEAYLAVLADRGFIQKKELLTFSRAGSRLIGHASNCVPGVEMCSGALGHGLSVGVGMALAAKRTSRGYRAFVVMGDGELAEGSVWEAAMAGAGHQLDNLWAIVDRNGLQISGPTEQVMPLENLAAKWEAFGWDVAECNGNDMKALQTYFHSQRPSGKPHCLLAYTVKGKGLPFAENRAEWHHKVLTREQLLEAYRALGVEGVDWA